MTNLIAHRGPDDEGHFIENNVGLGFRRLSIIDLNSGHQPMSDINEVAWIVFNGEIYNYQSLRNELINKGYIFKTNSDTEVIINSYKAYGEDCLERFRGMFSFLIWDKTKNKIFAARDRFGIKPFYYFLNNKHFVFGSELKSILISEKSNKSINLKALDSFFTYGYVLSPDSIYADIKKLPAGHKLTIDLNSSYESIKISKYWSPVFSSDNKMSFDELKQKIVEELRESVKMHLVSDVPVGAFLSGGIDSNAVVSQMAELSGNKIKTFTIGFEDKEFSEVDLAREAAIRYGTEHFELIVKPESANMIDALVDMFDEPFADSSAIPTFFVSRLARQHVKVTLSGDGGDEFFGGYNSYSRLDKMKKIRMPKQIRRPLFESISALIPQKVTGKRFSYILSKDPELAYAYFSIVSEHEKKLFYNKDMYHSVRNEPIENVKTGLIKNSISSDYLSKMMELDIQTFMVDDVLTKVDRASMATSLEVRVPIIDHEFFELASSIPTKFKIYNNKGKYILREAFKNFLPESIYSHRKQGFTIPIQKWFKSDLDDWVIDSLSNQSLTEYINIKYIENLKKSDNLGSLVTRIWPILIFSSWLNKNK